MQSVVRNRPPVMTYNHSHNQLHEQQSLLPSSASDSDRDAVPQLQPQSKPKASQWILWISILLLATAITFEGTLVATFQSYALSSFGANAYLGSISSVQNFINATSRPPIARLADVYGRFRAFVFSISVIGTGFLLLSAGRRVEVFVLAQGFYSLGQVGIHFLETIIAADNSSLKNRALASALPNIPILLTMFGAAPVADALLPDHWRWGYAMWAIVVPVASLPLLWYLWQQQKAIPHSTTISNSPLSLADTGEDVPEFDLKGLFTFISGLGCIVLSSTAQTIINHPILRYTMLLVGIIILAWFIRHSLFGTSTPLLPLHLCADRTVFSGCCLTFFFFIGFSVYQPYYFTYLVVAQDMAIGVATNAGLISICSAVLIGLVASMALKLSGRYKWFGILGSLVRILGSFVMLCWTDPETSTAQTFVVQSLTGAGTGMLSLVVQVGVQAAVARKDVATACALYATAGSLGGVVGDILSSKIWAPTLLRLLESNLPDGSKSQAGAIRDSIVVAQSYARGTEIRNAIDVSYAGAMRVLQMTSFGLFLGTSVFVLLMRDIPLTADKEDADERLSLRGNKNGYKEVNGVRAAVDTSESLLGNR